jgi:hypothetical protein
VLSETLCDDDLAMDQFGLTEIDALLPAVIIT